MSDDATDQIKLTHEGLRQLAAALLDAIQNGDVHENLSILATFNTNLLAGLLFGGSPSKDAALGGLDAYVEDVRSLINNNFDAAKAAMQKSDEKK